MENLLQYWWLLIPAAILLTMLIVMLIRTRFVRYRPVFPKAAEPDAALTKRAAESLSQMIKFRTTEFQNDEKQEFTKEILYIRERYHKVCETLNVSTVAGCGLLMVWKGSDSALKPILFCAHTDVVPAGAGWEHDPFGGERENGVIYGRGAVDCKGPAVAMLEALESLCEQGFFPRRDLYFSIGYDEETGEKTGAHLAAEYFKKQGITFEMVLDEGDFVMRSSPWLPETAAFVGVAEKGMITMRIVATASAGHAARPDGRTCSAELAEAILRIESAKFHPGFTKTSRAFFRALAPYMTGWEKFLYTNLWLTKGIFLRKVCKNPFRNAMVRSTAAVTMVYGGKAPNMMPDKMEAIVNIRILQGQSSADVCRYYEMLLSGCNVELVVDVNGEPSGESDTTGHYYKTLCRTIQDHFGRIPVLPTLLTSATDGRRFEGVAQQVYSFVPVSVSPEELSCVHAAEERISEEELGRAVEFYRDIIRNLQN